MKIEKPLYELKQFEFSIVNPFLADCEFEVSLQQKQNFLSVQQKDDTTRGAQGTSECGYPPPFGISKQLIRMSKGAEEKIRSAFLPFTPGLHRCLIWFSDVEHGRFCYELIGQALNPAVYSEHEFSVDLRENLLHIPISCRNAQIENAKKVWFQQHPLAKDKDLAKLCKARQPCVHLRLGHLFLFHLLHRIWNRECGSDSNWCAGDEMRFEVEHASSIIQCPKTITVSDRAGRAEKFGHNTELRLELKPVGIGLYPDRLILRNDHEIRVIDVMINVQELEHSYTLAFQCKARKGLVQQIPLFNNSDKAALITSEVRSLSSQW